MANTASVWLPASNDLSMGQIVALSVPSTSKPTPEEHRQLLADKLQRLVDSDRDAARQALEMSREHAPEMWLIAETNPVSQWGQALTSSDSAQSLLRAIDWEQSGTMEPAPEQSLAEIVESLP